jgi:hypothetical protein
MEHATGWPVVACWYDVESAFASRKIRYSVHGGITLRNTADSQGATFTIRALPLRPIWIGIIIDTLFYAAVWLLPLGGVRSVRRWRRRRRGLCAGCAYDLSGVPVKDGERVCPECGARV